MSNIIIPSNPTDQKALLDGIKELSNSMTRAESERDYQKESIKELAEKYQIDAKFIRRMAVDYHKDTFDTKTEEFDDYTSLYETIIKS